MIKKVLGLFLLLFSFFGVSFATNYELNKPTAIYNLQGDAVFTLTNGNNFNMNAQYYVLQERSAGSDHDVRTLFWSNTGLYYMSSRNGPTEFLQQGFLQRYCETTYGLQCNGANTNTWLDINNFISDSSFTNANILTTYDGGNDSYSFCFGYESLNKNICFQVRASYHNEFSQIKNGVGITRNPYVGNYTDEYSYISNYVSLSPFTSSSGSPNVPITGGVNIDGYDYINIHSGNYISYWEDNGFNQDMCYVGTRDLSGLYEDRIIYYQGTGYTIFDTYSKLFNVDSFSISQIGTFINYWLINYDTWFLGKNRYIDSTPYYNMIYNSPSDYYVDRGPNLTNIFAGNKVVYYFLASTIRDRNSYVDNGSIGEEVATYCYYKLTRYSNVSNDGQNYNINDNHDSSYDSNVAVYVRNKLNGIGSGFSFSGASVINSQTWDGSILDYYTGESYTDFNSFFSSSFNRFKYLFNLQNGDYGLGFIPSYIIIFLMGIILFRFLRH